MYTHREREREISIGDFDCSLRGLRRPLGVVRRREIRRHIYIYTHMYLVRHGNVLMVVYGFHRRDSRGPVAAGNQKKETNDGDHKKRFLATTETIKRNQRRKP